MKCCSIQLLTALSQKFRACVLQNVLRSRGRSVSLAHVRACLAFDAERDVFLGETVAPAAENAELVDVSLSSRLLSQFASNL